MRNLLCLSLFALAVSVLSPARAEITQCTNITALPAVISTQGVYCLKQDLSTSIASGAAISINANNVTLDCNDWKIGGLAAGVATGASGVSSGRLNTTIRNCGIRGFQTGINLWGGGGYLVEGNRLDHNTHTGIHLLGDANVVRRNRITDTGGKPLSDESLGMFVNARATLITDNLISNVFVTGDSSGNGRAVGISMSGARNVEIARNAFFNIIPAGTGPAYATLGTSGNELSSVRDNTALNPDSTNGTAFDGGAHKSICRNNSSHGFQQTIAWCTDAGGNTGT